ncbi:hypothetical protein AMTRI_Chr01g113390 [Amborella trichopoda]
MAKAFQGGGTQSQTPPPPPPPPPQTPLSLPTPSWDLRFLSSRKTHQPLTLSLTPSQHQTISDSSQDTSKSHIFGVGKISSHQGERSTTHQTRLHRSAQENCFSLFSFFSL